MLEQQTGSPAEEQPVIKPYGFREFLLNLRRFAHKLPHTALSMARLILLSTIISTCTGTVLYGATDNREFAFYATVTLIPLVAFHKEISSGVREVYRLVHH